VVEWRKSSNGEATEIERQGTLWQRFKYWRDAHPLQAVLMATSIVIPILLLTRTPDYWPVAIAGWLVAMSVVLWCHRRAAALRETRKQLSDLLDKDR
jgi:hypothetical protein